MADASNIVRQIHLYELAGFLSALAGGMAKAGLPTGQLTEVFSRQARLSCVDCGINLTGEELMTLALSQPDARMDQPKLARLRQGYCARQGCSSHYYTLTLSRQPGLDWAALLTAMEAPPEAPAADAAAPIKAAQGWARLIRNTNFIRLSIGLAILVVLLVCKYLLAGGSLPGFGHKHKYEVDPKSLIHDAPK